VLCGLFYLLVVLAYLRACEAESADGLWRHPWYWAAIGCATLALLSKSMAVSLPVILLILDVYPLARLGGERAGWRGWCKWRTWLEKVPFVLLSGAASVTAVMAMAQNQALASVGKLSVIDRAAVSVYSVVFYLWKAAVPLRLSPLYALPERVNPLSGP